MVKQQQNRPSFTLPPTRPTQDGPAMPTLSILKHTPDPIKVAAALGDLQTLALAPFNSIQKSAKK